MNLRQSFRSIVGVYFPRWRDAKNWRVSRRNPRGVQGYCDLEKKLISVCTDDPLGELMIHEICHAIASPGHGGKWQRRMLKAAEVAEVRDNRPLAEALRQTVEAYRTPDTTSTPNDLYGYARGWTLAGPDLSYSAIRRAIASEGGMLVSEVERKLPRLRRIYDKARKEALDMRRRQEEWRKKADESRGS